jgi:pyruvate formate lyase activating enzyme
MLTWIKAPPGRVLHRLDVDRCRTCGSMTGADSVMTNPSDVMRLPPPGEPYNLSGRVHSISARGTGAGPGVRFVIFLHGCPLRCAHCPDAGSGGGDGGHLDTVGKLIARISQYADYMRVSGGGVTVAGAEPLEQVEFVRELFRRCHDMGLPTALDTTGSGNLFAARGLLYLTDLVVLDLTAFDVAELDTTPASPRMRFATMLRHMDKPVWMRFAVIPGINDDPAHVQALAKFAASFPVLERVDVIPFQRMAADEWRKHCPLPRIQDLEPASAPQVRLIRNIFRSCGLRAD